MCKLTRLFKRNKIRWKPGHGCFAYLQALWPNSSDHKEGALLHTKAKDVLPVLEKLFPEKELDLSELALSLLE